VELDCLRRRCAAQLGSQAQRAIDPRRDAGCEHPVPVHHGTLIDRYCPKARQEIRWLRVSGTTEMPHIDQCVGHQFHTVVARLFELEAQQQPLELIFPREGPLHAEP